MAAVRRTLEIEAIVDRIRMKMKPWGITLAHLARQLGVSRQYAWQIVHERTPLSVERALAIEQTVNRIIEEQSHMQTFGDRLRAARISAGLTLKQTAAMIGYTWVGVQRWEKNLCVPKPGVVWHLCTLYRVGEEWFTGCFPLHEPDVLSRPTREARETPPGFLRPVVTSVPRGQVPYDPRSTS